jgi:hypothetical protein
MDTVSDFADESETILADATSESDIADVSEMYSVPGFTDESRI